jgi:hypothetical protein
MRKDATALSPRHSGGAVWTGKEVVIWGGAYVNGEGESKTKISLGDGAHYDPEMDSWTPMPSAGAPSQRAAFAHVWTGKEMLLWGGGHLGGAYYNDGCRYDPEQKQWSSLPQTGEIPKARDGFAYTWTGKKMLIWGGSSGGSILAQDPGGSYDPSLGTWKPLSVAGAPSGRHVAFVWTGSKAFLWGGAGSCCPTTIFHETGALYDPSADTWTPTTNTKVLTKRSAPFVWAGSVGVIWGGESAEGIFEDGAIYNPEELNPGLRWKSIPSGACPIKARSGHRMIWTGKEVLLWGGCDKTVCFNDGVRLDPQTLACSLLPPAPLPGRSHAVALWLPERKEMLIWGGYREDLQESVGDGARLRLE